MDNNHSFDGIEERDNKMPGWWIAVFFGTIVFAVVYYVHYELGRGQSIQQELARDEAMYRLKFAKRLAEEAVPLSDIEKAVKDPKALASGREVFGSKCASCHGAEGKGNIGPNLTDTVWLYGDGGVQAILASIRDGIPKKGMPAWGTVLSAGETKDLTAFVKSMANSMESPMGNATELPN